MSLKKIITSMFLLLLTLISCGKKEEIKTEGLTGKILVQVEEPWVPYYEAAINRVKEKNPSAEISLKVAPSFDHLEILDKTDVTNEDVADVFAIPLDRFEGLYSKDSLAAFDAKALAEKIGGFKNYDKGLASQLAIDGSYYGIPFNIETLILGINKANALANSVDLENIDIANLSPTVATLPIFNAWWAVAITNAFGVELLGKDNDKFFSDLTKDWEMQSDEVKAMFEGIYTYWKKSNEARLPMFDITAVYGFMDDLFKTGKTGSVRVIGPWDLTALTDLAGKDFDIASLDKVKFAGKVLKHWQSGWALVINARNEEDMEKLALSEAIIKELLNPNYALDFYKYTSKVMPNVSKEEYEKLDLPELDKKSILSVIDSYENAVSRPLFKEWGQVWDTWQTALISWESKKPKNAQEAYKEVQSSFKALLTNLGE